jgi:hypothetical protein
MPFLGPNHGLPGRGPHPPFRSRKGIGYANVVSITTYPEPSNEGAFIAVRAANQGGDHNEVWKFESGGTELRITDSLPIGGTFEDHAVKSGVTYFYFTRTYNANGTFVDSSTVSSSVIFGDFKLHAVVKDDSTNLSGASYTFKAVTPQNRSLSRAQEMLYSPALAKPIAAPGEIVQRIWSVQIWSPNLSLTDIRSLEALTALNQVLCVRDGRGRLMFGTISELPITYGVTTVINLSLSESDYHEHVA